jgi:membrane-associated phospholipid phosphatase
MIIFFKPAFALSLLALFLAVYWSGGPANGVEIGIMEWFAAIRASSPPFASMAGALTSLGGAYVTVGLTAAAALWLLLRRAPARALLLAATVLIERSAVEELKILFGRARPDVGVEWLPHSLAFPSGHSANSMTAFLAAALIAAPPELRRTAAIAAVALSVLVGLTRVALGVHWPSDVFGGWAFGLLAVWIAMAIGRRAGLSSLEPQHEIVGGHRAALDEDETS